MIPPPQEVFWQSEDGLVHAGWAQTATQQPYYYATLGPRSIQLTDIQGLLTFYQHLQQPWPLLLVSCCSGFAPNTEEESQGLVFYAGRMRQRQQQEKQSGRRLLSYIFEQAVGGTYLMHGLSAPYKAGDPHTKFHGTLLSQPPSDMQTIVARGGLVDSLVPLEQFPFWLEKHLPAP